MTEHPEAIDPFDLPAWVGEAVVTWSPERGIRRDAHLAGRLTTEGEEDLPCDLLAVDEAYPAPVATDDVRTLAHQLWRHGQVHLVSFGGRLTLAVPGQSFTADRVLEVLGRLAAAVGARPERMAALLNVGRDTTPSGGSGR
ncbi:MAG: hypothetical protein U0R80_17940 [Nocardioidaceae bacterium]